MNVHENPDLTIEYGINVIAQVFLVQRHTKPLRRFTGLTTEGVLAKTLNKVRSA